MKYAIHSEHPWHRAAERNRERLEAEAERETRRSRMARAKLTLMRERGRVFYGD